MRRMNWLRLFGLAVVACCLVSATPARALESGVYLIDGGSDYYFVDADGFRHVIQDPETVRTRWFADRPINRVSSADLDALPIGDVISESVGPDMVVKRRKTTTITDEDGTTSTKTEESTEVRP